jgi:hypothetical protein
MGAWALIGEVEKLRTVCAEQARTIEALYQYRAKVEALQSQLRDLLREHKTVLVVPTPPKVEIVHVPIPCDHDDKLLQDQLLKSNEINWQLRSRIEKLEKRIAELTPQRVPRPDRTTPAVRTVWTYNLAPEDVFQRIPEPITARFGTLDHESGLQEDIERILREDA